MGLQLKIIEQENIAGLRCCVASRLIPSYWSHQCVKSLHSDGATFARIFDEVYAHIQRHDGQIADPVSTFNF